MWSLDCIGFNYIDYFTAEHFNSVGLVVVKLQFFLEVVSIDGNLLFLIFQ